MVEAFGADHATSILDQSVFTICLASQAQTAKWFSELCGVTEAYVDSFQVGQNTSFSTNFSHGASGGNANWSEGWARSDGTSSGTGTALMSRPAVLESEVSGLPTPDNVVMPGRVRYYAVSANTGCFYGEFDIAAEVARLPPLYSPPNPDRDERPLRPLALADLMRLGLQVDEGMVKALNDHPS
jgi:hypothetical protein